MGFGSKRRVTVLPKTVEQAPILTMIKENTEVEGGAMAKTYDKIIPIDKKTISKLKNQPNGGSKKKVQKFINFNFK